ncbi:tRNA-guanine transglycosylase DpdA [Ruegeria sp. HKCCSP335]|uniref:tRNA-guanine transglycosylase DpdA n=1 Tax=Ruegeria sp. HKCCSP335 TaxID=2794833 RepID=UPI001AE3D1B9|nr:tRNA-guanine transglycosylase DpdA [Ruegeria sp. HKCCSP335]
MKFIFADSLDYVDPRYDFLEDRSPSDREPYWDDVYPHELLGYAPYDGILVSRAIVGGNKVSGKYTDAQAQRFRRVGAREFLRFREADYPGSFVFGDCGAFTYHEMKFPPYTSEEMVDFYGDGQFTHGCSIDHIIFDYVEDHEAHDLKPERLEENRRRFEITSANAEEFLQQSKRIGNSFTPMGVVQGWSPASMAEAALRLKKMGYKYIAIGGMVPLRAPQIKTVLTAIREAVGNDLNMHVLGFAKAEEIHQFSDVNITSFDTTSPLLRAFKDSTRNYYALKPEGGIEYFSAIRIPQAIENNSLKNLAKQGVYSQEDLINREARALKALRAFDRGEADAHEALEDVMAYTAPLAVGRDDGHSDKEKRKLDSLREKYQRTLEHRPWQSCDCSVCKKAGVETIIFRASNRNKRRGIHNIQAYQKHIRKIEKAEEHA